MRLNKAIANLGICSRRDADKFILDCKVKVNKILVTNFGTHVNYNDIISVNNVDYKFEQKASLWIFNKPSGIITTHKDEFGRETVFDYVRNMINQRVISVGRLDFNSEGLLLLTNNGDFVRLAETGGWERHYKVRFLGNMTPNIIQKLKRGITINGQIYAPLIINVECSEQKTKNNWCTCILTEGKNREIRKIFQYFGLIVNRLIRIQYGPYKLGTLPIGKIKEAPLIKI